MSNLELNNFPGGKPARMLRKPFKPLEREATQERALGVCRKETRHVFTHLLAEGSNHLGCAAMGTGDLDVGLDYALAVNFVEY